MTKLEELEQEVGKIKERNRRVEADKAWETSFTRRVFIAAATYFLILVFLMTIGAEKPFSTAIIPALAYLLSTISLGILKSWWLQRRKPWKLN